MDKDALLDTKEQIKYTTILHGVRRELRLSANEYLVIDTIYHLQASPKSLAPGWCYARKDRLAKMLGLSKQSIHTIINKLIKEGLLIKDEETKYLQATARWYEIAIIEQGKETLPRVKNLDSKSKETLPQQGKESLPNNNSIDNNSNNNTLLRNGETEKIEYGNKDINEVLAYLQEKLGLPDLDGGQGLNRRYAWSLIKTAKTGTEGVKWLIDQAAMDGWWRNHITSMRDLWNNKVKILSSKRSGVKVYAVPT